jgi:hypothetical protein
LVSVAWFFITSPNGSFLLLMTLHFSGMIAEHWMRESMAEGTSLRRRCSDVDEVCSIFLALDD